MKYLLALDQGTTSSRALVIDYSGKVIAVAQKEFTQFFPQPGWVEHDANEIWASQIGVAADAIGRADISHKDIAAIGITNQRETAVVWDRKSGEPICPCHCLAGPSDRSDLRSDANRWPGAAGAEENGPGNRRLLLRNQGALDSRQRAWRPRKGRARRIGFWND